MDTESTIATLITGAAFILAWVVFTKVIKHMDS